MNYTINKISDTLYYIDDEYGCSMYFVIGKKKAILIDTGMSKEPLLPLLQQYTTLPIEVILTHAHIDHMYYIDEFEKVYIHSLEKKHWRFSLWFCVFAGALMYKIKHKHYALNKMIRIDEGASFDLGNGRIEVINAFGHTPGSIVLVDHFHQTIYCGDAFGSGQFVWMWLPGSLCVSDYQQSLIHLRNKLAPYANYQFYGGHHQQASKEGAHPLSLGTIDDMIKLCDLILKHQIEPIKKEKMMGMINVYTYQYNKGAMVISKGNIK